jgi:hypothetical protein
MNIENLKIWRDFLISNDVPFCMTYLHQNADGTQVRATKDLIDKGAKGCGTAGCAVGWAPFVLPPMVNEFYKTDNCLDVWRYMNRVFGIDSLEDGGEFDYIAASAWTHVDNSRLGAAYRIHCVITGAFDPDDEFIIDDLDYDEYATGRDAWVASL